MQKGKSRFLRCYIVYSTAHSSRNGCPKFKTTQYHHFLENQSQGPPYNTTIEWNTYNKWRISVINQSLIISLCFSLYLLPRIIRFILIKGSIKKAKAISVCVIYANKKSNLQGVFVIRALVTSLSVVLLSATHRLYFHNGSIQPGVLSMSTTV